MKRFKTTDILWIIWTFLYAVFVYFYGSKFEWNIKVSIYSSIGYVVSYCFVLLIYWLITEYKYKKEMSKWYEDGFKDV